MKRISWNAEKNEWLVRERGISFERIVDVIEQGGLLDVIEHHNPSKYPHQRIWIVNVDGYAYHVPVVESDDAYFLKTIYPSRKDTKRYLGSADD